MANQTILKKNSTSDLIRIGWIGTGVMGQSMCGHLLKEGYPVTLYNRTQSKATALIQRGARWLNSPKEVAQNSDIIFTIVGYPKDVEDVYFGSNGIFDGVQPDSVLIDMTTTSPSLSQKIAKKAETLQVIAIDAPVSGGDIGARDATLSIMIGGHQGVVNYVMPLFKILGGNLVYQGESGMGQHAKMSNQIVIAGTMIGVCESLMYAYKAGLNVDVMLESVRGGAAACWTLDHLAPRIVQKKYDPGFCVDHFVKDMEIALSEAQRMKLSLPGLALVHQLYVALQAQGHGKCGTHALMKALELLSDGEA
ncbi:NAD(P)-dependent oxidoreductase [Deltaproteobacteria bacterium TL4]